MEDCRARETGPSSPRMETSRPATEWTDEKHRLYLKSMEASFVNELYRSEDISSWRTPVEKFYPHSSQKMHLNARASRAQFKVLRGAIWQKISLNKTVHLEKANGSRLPMGNSWIRHFRSSCRQAGSSLARQDSSGADSQTMNLMAKKGLCTTFSTCPEPPAGCLHVCHQVDGHKEVSDQNFIGEEDIGGEKLGSSSSEGKSKARFTDASIDDQVVPLGNPALLNDLAESCASPERRDLNS